MGEGSDPVIQMALGPVTPGVGGMLVGTGVGERVFPGDPQGMGEGVCSLDARGPGMGPGVYDQEGDFALGVWRGVYYQVLVVYQEGLIYDNVDKV